MRSRNRMLAGLVALAVALTGCAGIPRDGGVREGQAVQPGSTPAPVFLPSRPQKDASPEAILRGFIDAATSPDNDYAIAREFLAPNYSGSWEPDTGVTVDDASGRSIVAVGEGQMQFSVNPVAEVDERGEYREVESPTAVALRYQFVQVGGQWRIGAAPNGTVVDRNIFQDVFTAQALYFFDPGFSYLVPDLRWYPRGGATLTKIVNGLLAGPSPWLTGAVVTAFPDGTKLTADAVQVIARDAKVDLNSEALNADRVTLQRMKAQLANSLPPGLSATITVNRNMQDIADLNANAPTVNPRVDARALILREGEFGFLAASGSAISPIAGLSGSIVALGPTAVTLSPGQTAAAVLNTSGVFGVRVGDDPVPLDPRPGLIAPSIDNYGFVWSVPAARPGELIVYGPNGEATAVPTPWPEASAIQSLRVSRDGTRLIALLQNGKDSRFVVTAITRDKSTPVALGDAVLLAAPGGTAVDAAWIDELTVACLTRLPGGEERIVALQLGGLGTRLESAPDSVTMVGSNNLRDLRALSSTGGLLVQRGAGWQERLGGVTLLATQQGIGG
ncbi:MAG TPA: LpqB family beta-propeller domain-containing protein [Cryobacterium sp.]|nr:LpqB family beta-propeller domain-containing protein [Cryobacterium sp.]